MEHALPSRSTAVGHPLRQTLPVAPPHFSTAEDRWGNVRLFLMTFVAGFVGFYGLIA